MLDVKKLAPGATVTLLHCGEPSPMDLNAMKIARFMGAETAAVRWPGNSSDCGIPSGACLIVSAQTLCQLAGAAAPASISSIASNVFVYGFHDGELHSRTLEKLTGGRIKGVARLSESDAAFGVDEHSRDVSRQFAGLRFGKPNPETDLVFVGDD